MPNFNSKLVVIKKNSYSFMSRVPPGFNNTVFELLFKLNLKTKDAEI